MEFRELLKRRKSVRTYEARPVPRDVLDRVMASVRHAPSAGYTQGNEFLVLDDPAAVAEFWSLTTDPGSNADDTLTEERRGSLPPVLVLPLANRKAYLDRYSMADKAPAGLQEAESWPVPYWDIDAGMASMLILLAAVDEGLAAWFFGIQAGEQKVVERFGIASEFKPIGVIGLGYAAAADPGSANASPARIARRPVESLLHYNGW